MKRNAIIALVLIIVSCFCCFACKKEKVDISGYYTAEKLNTLYYFSPDGKIYENESFESYSCYEVKGNKIITYIENAREASEMVFPFELTDDGFMMGQLRYTKIPDYEDFISTTPTDEDADENS